MPSIACTALVIRLTSTRISCGLGAMTKASSMPIYVNFMFSLLSKITSCSLRVLSRSISTGSSVYSFANVEKSFAVSDSIWMCSSTTAATWSNFSSHLGLSFCFIMISLWICSLIGVRGFLISCATWRAIWLHALSLSACASFTVESFNSFTIRL